MVKDDGTAQSKGWFGRKSNPVTPPQKVSRPPSASSFTPYKRKKSQVPEVDATDDDLPPRGELQKPTGSSGSPPPPQIEKGEETPGGDGDAEEPTPAVPLHAGFDFAAIKDVLEESKGTEEGKPAAFLSPVPEHMIPPASPITRSGSAPPYTPTHVPPSNSPLSRDFNDADEYGACTLTPKFSQLSLSDTPNSGRNNGFTSSSTILGPEVPTKSPLPSDSPSLSFGGYDGSIWQALPNDVYQSGAAASTPSLSPSAEGRANGSHGYLSSSLTINPFVSKSSLSFGGPGGTTIDYTPSSSIVPPSNNEADPWTSSLTRGKKPTSGFNSNPWA